MVIFPSQRPVMPSGKSSFSFAHRADLSKGWGFAALMLSIGLLGFCAQAALTTGLQKEKAGRATVANYIQMPAAMTCVQVLFCNCSERIPRLEFLIFKRLPDLLSTIGATVILSSALIVVLSKQPKNTVPTVPGVEDLHEEDGQVELSPSRPTSQYLPVKTEDEV
jgi:drug/metabolite transporter (DMT)-like permease